MTNPLQMYGQAWFPRQVDIDDLRDYWQPGKEGVEQRYAENLWVNNPWFIANENTNAFQVIVWFLIFSFLMILMIN